jgi:hypothetical protein
MIKQSLMAYMVLSFPLANGIPNIPPAMPAF